MKTTCLHVSLLFEKTLCRLFESTCSEYSVNWCISMSKLEHSSDGILMFAQSVECWPLDGHLQRFYFLLILYFQFDLLLVIARHRLAGPRAALQYSCHLAARDVQQTKECKIFATNWIFSSLILATPHQQVKLSIRSDLTPAPDSILLSEANIRQSWLRSRQDCIQYCIGFIEVSISISRY